MSLIVCSSQQSRYNYKNQGNARPYSFQNYLGNAMKIPKHSEVAVQSIKIDRAGVFEIKEQLNDRGFILFGWEYTLGEDYESDYVEAPLPVFLREGQYNHTTYKSMLTDCFNDACSLHPDLKCKSIDYVVTAGKKTNIAIEIEGRHMEPTATALTGNGDQFRVNKINMRADTTFKPFGVVSEDSDGKNFALIPTNNGVPTFALDPSSGEPEGWVDGQKRWYGRNIGGGSTKGLNVAMFPAGYCSFQAGNCSFGVDSAVGTTVCEWHVGLVRAQKCGKVGDGPISITDQKVKIHNSFNGNNNLNKGLPDNFLPRFPLVSPDPDTRHNGRNETEFYDYQVCCMLGKGTDETGIDMTKYYLRVFASGHKVGNPIPKGGAGRDLNLVYSNANDEAEIKYWLIGGALLTDSGPYDCSGDPRILSQLQFITEGEQVTLFGNFAGTQRSIVPPRTDTNAYAFPPIVGTKYKLYPKCAIANEPTKYIEFYDFCFNGRTHATDVEGRRYGDCLYGQQCRGRIGDDDTIGLTNMEMDSKWQNQSGSEYGTSAEGGAMKTVTATKHCDFQMDLVLGEHDDGNSGGVNQFRPNEFTNGFGLDTALGFDDNFQAFTDGAESSNRTGRKWTSATMPEGFALQSLFVSCPTLTQISHNFTQGTPSKIIYHLPLFDNQGASTGPLFFEASEKTYLKLGNTEDLYIDHLDLNIVGSDEVIADDLEGNTVIVLHIKDSRGR